MNKHTASVSDALWLYRVSRHWQEGVRAKALKWNGKSLRSQWEMASEGVARTNKGGIDIAGKKRKNKNQQASKTSGKISMNL